MSTFAGFRFVIDSSLPRHPGIRRIDARTFAVHPAVHATAAKFTVAAVELVPLNLLSWLFVPVDFGRGKRLGFLLSYLAVILLALYAPAFLWAWTAGVAIAPEQYPFWPTVGPVVFFTVLTWSSLGVGTGVAILVGVLGIVLGLGAAIHRTCIRGLVVAYPLIVFGVSMGQAILAFGLASALDGVSHS